MRASLLPHPLLTLLVASVWVLISNELSVATVLVGAVWGIAVARLTARYWPGRPRVARPILVLEYLALFVFDVLISNLQVAALVLFRRADEIRSCLVTVPLELKSPEAIAALAGTITLTPGTLSVDVSADSTALRVHCLGTAEGERIVANVKRRYEDRLRRIFE
ncbi:MAG TPA: Na+/H+ antiporter subunit E [Burkholderiales bacterium]|nr:Na+/H+ antiporter subunit E [Burkholderiales bacterium]